MCWLRFQSGTFKDQDLNDMLYLPTAYRNTMLAALERDTQFLALHKIMDYSLVSQGDLI